MKKIYITLAVFTVFLASLWFFWSFSTRNAAVDYKNTTYMIDGEKVTLVNGVAESEIPSSSSKDVVRYFGNEVHADFNGDTREDVAFLLTKNSGGSGTFFYIVGSLATARGYAGTNAILLGDRIAPQTTEFRNGEIIVNYATRKDTDPMTAQPSVGVSRYFKIEGSNLVELLK